MHTPKVVELTPRLQQEVDEFGAVLATTPATVLMMAFESPPPRQSMPQRWINCPSAMDDAA